MRNTLLCLALLLATHFAQAAGPIVALVDLHKREGVYWLAGDQQAFTGTAEAPHRRHELKDGRLHGLTRYYWPNGKLQYEAEYEKGAVHGYVRRYYENGQLSYEGSRWKGREAGIAMTCYFEDGREMNPCNGNAMTGGTR